MRAYSSAGRAPALQAGGRWFESSSAHQMKYVKGIIATAFIILLILALPLCFFYEEALGHPDEDGECHRPDDNECRHPCHHEFCKCARPCAKKCETDEDKWCYDKCFKACLAKHSECVSKCKDD